MNLRTLSSLAGIAGGVAWVVRAFVGEEPEILYWVGVALLAAWLAGSGASLVKKGTWWLRLIVAVALPLLVWSIYAAVRPATDALLLDAVCGCLAIVAAVLVLVFAPAPARSHGSHAR